MSSRKRLVVVDRGPKVYVDIDDDSWRIKSEVEDEGEPSGAPRSPGKSPYSLRNSPRIPQIIPSDDEALESSDGDFLSSSDEYQPESDGDQSESDPGYQWGIVTEDQSDIDPDVEWDETDDSELEWTDVKIEKGSGMVRCESEDRIIYPRVPTKSLGTQKEKVSRNQRTTEVSSCQMSLRSSGLKTRSNKVYAAKLIHTNEKLSRNRKARFQRKQQNQNTTIQHKGNDQRKSRPDENTAQILDEISEPSTEDLVVEEIEIPCEEDSGGSEKDVGPNLRRRQEGSSDYLVQQQGVGSEKEERKSGESSTDQSEENITDQSKEKSTGQSEKNSYGQSEKNSLGKSSRRKSKASPAIDMLPYSRDISILVRKTLTKHERKTWCLYCGRKVFQLALHLQCKHLKEREVVEMNKYGKNTKLRKKRLQSIFDKGLCRHNDRILEVGKGALIPLRRPLNTEGLTADQFCHGCYVFVDKNFVETHKLSCRKQNVEIMKKQGDESSGVEVELTQNSLNITDHMINNVQEKLKQISKNGQIKVIEEKQHNSGVTCAYCHIVPCHFSRHIERKHSEEPMVTEVLSHPLGSQERKTGWTKLRNTCHFFHNKAVLEAGSGELVIGYVQANQSKDPSLLEICAHCYGLFWCIQSHIKRCQKNLPLDSLKAKKKTCECMSVRSVDTEIPQNGSPSYRADDTGRTYGTNKTGDSNGAGIHWQKRWDGKKKFRKVNCCVYCQTPQYKMSKHYVEKHGAEEEVQKAMKYPKQSKGKRDIFSMLILRGNNEHNKRVLERGQGTLIPPRKLQEEPNQTVAEDFFSYCSLCFARVQSVTMWAHMKKHRMSAQVTSQKTTNEEDALVDQPGSEPSLREERGGFETRIGGMDNDTWGSSEINPHLQNVDNQGVIENSAHTNLEREEGVENRQNACIGKGASNGEGENSGGEASSEEGTSNGERASNKEGACRSSQDDQQAIRCEPEMEGERCSVSQSVEGGGHRPEAECHGRETLDGREKEIQPTIITVKRGSKEVLSCMKYSADISILLSTVQSFCPYCQKSSINMIKHLQLRHATERDVQEAIKMPIEFEAGKKLWADLIMRGNKEHNDRVMQAGAGDLIPLRRIHRAATLKDYDFCFTCYLFIKKVNHMHKFFCKNSRQTFDDIEEETLRRSAVDSRHNCFCKAAAKAEAAAKSPDMNRRKNTGVAKFHIKSDSSINFDQSKNMEKMKISKSQCCLYCQKLIVRMSDHLTKAHSDQQEVQQALRHPKKSKERRRLFLVLLKKGNYKHNKRVSHLGSGFMIPVSLHRQRFGDHGRFLHCEVCLGLYSTRGFKKHMERHHNEGDTTENNTQGLFMNGEGNQKIKQLPPRSASNKVKILIQDNASGENQDVSGESSEESDDEWDRAEFRRLQRAKYRRLQKRKQSQRDDQSGDRAGQDGAAGDGATQQGAALMQHGPTKEKRRKVARKGVKLWNDEELAAIDSFFSKHIEELRVPGKEQCDAAKQKFPEALKKRDWKGIKFCVYNKIQTRKKQKRREEEGDGRSTDKCPWTQPEVCAVEKHMQSFINNLVTPGKLDCLQVKRRCGAVLRGRSWKQIKFYVYNRVLKQRRMQSNG